MQVQPLGQEDALEKEMGTYSSIPDWRGPWTEEPGGSIGLQRAGHDRVTEYKHEPLYVFLLKHLVNLHLNLCLVHLHY